MKVSLKINKESIKWLKPVKQGSIVTYLENNIPTFVNSVGKSVYSTKVDYENSFNNSAYEKDYYVDSLKYETKEDGNYITFNLLDTAIKRKLDYKNEIDEIVNLIYKKIEENDNSVFPDIRDNEYLIKMLVSLKGNYSLKKVSTQEMFVRKNEQKAVEFYKKRQIDFEELMHGKYDYININDSSNFEKQNDSNKNYIKPIEIMDLKDYFRLCLDENLYKKENQLFVCPYNIKRYVSYCENDSDLKVNHNNSCIKKCIEKAEVIRVLGEVIFKDYKKRDDLALWLTKLIMRENFEYYGKLVKNYNNNIKIDDLFEG